MNGSRLISLLQPLAVDEEEVAAAVPEETQMYDNNGDGDDGCADDHGGDLRQHKLIPLPMTS